MEPIITPMGMKAVTSPPIKPRLDAGTNSCSRLTEAQLPRPDNEGEDEADQEIVEELQHIAEDCSYDNPPLVGSQ